MPDENRIIKQITDPILTGLAGKRVVKACFILENGVEIWYQPKKARGDRWVPISATCGKGGDGVPGV